jgi:ElaB/YqjD/DUF883 family membrane-anchored ribosome-binding protein
MESTKKMKDQAETGHPSTENQGKTGTQKASSTIENIGANITAKGGEVVEQAKEVVNDVYNRASKKVNEGYNQAIDYGRENPGKATLIAFGAGLGLGLLLSGALLAPSRSRSSRIVPSVLTALSDIASEIL